MVRRTIAVGTFPGLVVGAGLGVVLGRAAGLPDAAVVGATLALSALILLALQRVMPAVPEWRGWARDAPFDLAHAALSSFGSALVARTVAVGALLAVAGAIERSGLSPWPSGWPLAAQVALAMVLADLPAYAIHRASHTWEPLWRLHALHHSSERLHLLSAGRNHPAHTALSTVFESAPLLLLGVPPGVLAVHAAVTGVIGLLQHANVALASGPLDLVFATADLHRWHHSAVREESWTNFGNNLALWDLVFGTWSRPADRRVPERVGIDGVAFPRNLWLQLASPLLWPAWSAAPREDRDAGALDGRVAGSG